MNKNKKNRKGFTIVELVIVIAVIGILATVLVPTFGDVITNAKKSAALQEAKNSYNQYVAEFNYNEGTPAGDMIYKVGGYFVAVDDSAVQSEVKTTYADAQALVEAPEGKTYTWPTEAVGQLIPTIAE